jgi:hypothetical protein
MGEDDKPTSGTITLHGSRPALPAGVLQTARTSGFDDVTWQPEPGLRMRSSHARRRQSRRRPYDAEAARGVEQIYLEAKGTQSIGDSVIVTRNEVNHARQHPGLCRTAVVRDADSGRGSGSCCGDLQDPSLQSRRRATPSP